MGFAGFRWVDQLRDSIGASISACHADDPGSIPGFGGVELQHEVDVSRRGDRLLCSVTDLKV